MTNYLSSIVLTCLWLLGGRQQGMGPGPGTPSTGTCVPPPVTSRWSASNPSNVCGQFGGSSCTTTGQLVYQVPDLAGSNQIHRTTGANQPGFQTNQINGLPAFSFGGAAWLDFTTPIPTSTAQYTFYAIIEFTSVGSAQPIFNSSSATANSIVWDLDSSKKQGWGFSGVAGPFLGTNVYAVSTWYAFEFQVDTVAKTYAYSRCVAGTCSSDGSGTYASGAPTVTISALGDNQHDGVTLHANVAEAGFFAGYGVTGVGPWAFCHFAI